MPSPAKVIEIASTPLDAIDLPATSIRVDLGENGEKAFVFWMSTSARLGMETERFEAFARQLGNLVHPHPALLVVLPDGEQLGAYRVEVA